MPSTLIRGNQVVDEGIQRIDLNVTTAGQAVIRKVIAGTGVTLTSTGVDAGTGDVTINASGTAATVAVGTTTTGAAGSSASVTNSGSTSAAVFNFTVPQGATGAAGAGDPWTYVKLAAPVTADTITVDTALAFTPLSNLHYVVEGVMVVRSPAITTGIRPGIKWPLTGSSLISSAALISVANSASTLISRVYGLLVQNVNAASLATATANEDTYAEMSATFVTGATSAGTFGITLTSEIAGSLVSMRVGSYLRYRTI